VGSAADDEIDVLHSLRQLPRLFEAEGDERHDDVAFCLSAGTCFSAAA